MIWQHHQRRSIHWFLSNPLWRCWLLSLRCLDFQMFSVDLDEACLVQWLKVISRLFLFRCVLNCLVHAKKHQKTWKIIHFGGRFRAKIPWKFTIPTRRTMKFRDIHGLAGQVFVIPIIPTTFRKVWCFLADKNLGDLPQLGVLEFHQNEDRSSHQGKRDANEVVCFLRDHDKGHTGTYVPQHKIVRHRSNMIRMWINGIEKGEVVFWQGMVAAIFWGHRRSILTTRLVLQNPLVFPPHQRINWLGEHEVIRRNSSHKKRNCFTPLDV